MRTNQISFRNSLKKKARISPVSCFSALALVIAAPVLSGCGFHPVDAYRHDSRQNTQLSTIFVAPIPERDGQILRFDIKKALNPQGISMPSVYALNVTYSTKLINRGTRSDDSSVIIDVTNNAQFTLKNIKTGALLLSGNSSAVTSKQNTEALYAAYVSEESARKNSSKLVAQDIARQVSLFFKYPGNYPAHKAKTAPKKSAAKITRPQRAP